jgi:hypothetical protein
LGDCQSGEDAK